MVDPHSVHGSALVPPLTSSHASRKEFLLRRYTRAVDTLILGSSRAMTLSPRVLEKMTGSSGFNASVGSATPVEFLAWWRLLLSLRGEAPQLLLVSVDLDSFNSSWRTISQSSRGTPILNQMVPEFGAVDDPLFDPQDLGWQRLVDSLHSVYLYNRGYPPESEVFEADGLVTFRQLEEKRRHGVTALKNGIQKTLAQAEGRFSDFQQLSPEQLQAVKTLLDEARGVGTRVFLYLPPIHPLYRVRLGERSNAEQMRAALRKRLLVLCAEHSVTFADFTDARSIPIDPQNFYDGVHFPQAEADKLLRRLLNLEAEEPANALQ